MKDNSREVYTGPENLSGLQPSARLEALFRLKFAQHITCVEEWTDYDRLVLTNAQDPSHPHRHTREFDLQWHTDGRQFMSVHVPRRSPDDSPPYMELLLNAGASLAVRPAVFIHGSLEPWLPDCTGDIVLTTNQVVDAVADDLAASAHPRSI